MASDRFVVVGAGAVGCYIGAHLAAAGKSVVFIGRARIGECARDRGLRARRMDGGAVFLPAEKVLWSETLDAARDADIVLVTVKSQDTQESAERLNPILPKNARIVSFQNGVRNADNLRAALPGRPVFGGIVPFNVVPTDDASSFAQTASGALLIDAAAKDGAPGLFAAAKASGLVMRTTDRLAEMQWGKLLINLNNALNALSGLSLREQLADRAHRRIMAASLEEALRVMARAGILADTGMPLPARWMPRVLRAPDWLFGLMSAAQPKIDPNARSSMSADLRLGRRTEVDYLNGEIVRLAQRLGASAPIHARIVALVKQEESRRAAPAYSAMELERALGVARV